MAWGDGGWGQVGWGRGIFAIAPAVERASAVDLNFTRATMGFLAVATAGIADFPKVTPAFLTKVIERASGVDFPSAMQEFAVLERETASAHDFAPVLIGVTNFTITERASTLDLASVLANFAAFVDERASAAEAVTVGAFIQLLIPEGAVISEADMFAEHIMNTLIREAASLGYEFIGLPVFDCRVLGTASAAERITTLAELIATAVERANAKDFDNAPGSTYKFGITERARAHDIAVSAATKHILVVETAGAKDTKAAVTDLWVPVDDNAPGIWVPVNDNPTGPWVPVV